MSWLWMTALAASVPRLAVKRARSGVRPAQLAGRVRDTIRHGLPGLPAGGWAWGIGQPLMIAATGMAVKLMLAM